MQVNIENIKAAIKTGSAHLRKQLLSGHYGLACLGKDGKPKFSNEKGHLFSTFHIVNALKGEMNEIERTIFLTRLLSEEYKDQWGYSPRGYYKDTGDNPFFVDADDTSFALRTFRALDVYRSNDILLKYETVFDHGNKEIPAFVTFISEPEIKKIATQPNFANNLQIHPEVNANLYHCLLDSNNDYLINEELIALSQGADGSWHSYFYPDKHYSTFLFMSLLHQTKTLGERYSKGMNYVLSAQNENGSWGVSDGDAYLSALALKTLCLDKNLSDNVMRGLAYLLATINDEGYWKTNQMIWNFHDHDGDIWMAYDSNDVIATSLCVEVFKQCLEIIK